MGDVKERTKRIAEHESVKWLVIADSSEKILDVEVNQKIVPPGEKGRDEKLQPSLMSKHILSIAKKARNTVKELDSTNDLTFLRIKTAANEIMVATDKDYFLIVNQLPQKPEEGAKP
eukprot:TRINITY_DN2208_c0_g1_i2.p3 TRINITY_DN2208_c0_g1~~TRINITY_DN2208_c0_g1_i2.p3  ORF type:complete len:117 (+),score=48.77 TRINITY_DN2208_c0_g1_i2:121-471(+)